MKTRTFSVIVLAVVLALLAVTPGATATQTQSHSIWRNYTTADGLADNFVMSIAIDGAGHKWFGTGGGVSEFDGSTWTTYTTADGLADNWVRAIAIDGAGHQWFVTGSGVSEFIPDGVSGNVTVAGGGSITSGDGLTTLTFAPGTVGTDLKVIFIPEPALASAPLRGIGHSYELYAVRLGTSGPPVETIPGTYTVVVQYSDSEVFLVKESTLALYSWDGIQWMQEPTSVADTLVNTVTATPAHFSYWALLGELRTDLLTIYLPVAVKNAP